MTVSLSRAATLLSVMLLGLLGTGGAVALWSIWQLSAAVNAQGDAAALMRAHMRADMMHDAIRGDVLAALASRDPAAGTSLVESRRDLAEHIETLNGSLAVYGRFATSPELRAATDQLGAPMKAYGAAAHRIVMEWDGRTTPDLSDFYAQFSKMEESMEQASEAIEAHATATGAEAAWLETLAFALVLAALGVSLAVAFLFGRAVRLRLVRPLLALIEAMRRMTAGDREVDIPASDARSELGALAAAMAEFRDQLKRAEQATAAQARLIVGSLGNGLKQLARGDLTSEIDADLQPPFAELKTDFNAAVVALRALIGAVGEGAASIRIGSGEIARASSDLARRTEQNAASLGRAATAITAMDERLKAAATAATATVTRADGAMATVAAGRSVTDEAVAAMVRVADSAKRIDTVIEGLNKIAFQTRVLAMNAAIEAGRAGEVGRGFAVVADLVSALAKRAEEEAAHAREQLTITQSDIGAAVGSVERVDGALAAITVDVEQVHKLLADMADDNVRQAQAIGDINGEIGQMDMATQQNAAMVEQTSAAARHLSDEVGQLAEHAERFVTAAATPPLRLRVAA
jgi:methyl-accepting chemotaxis protein